MFNIKSAVALLILLGFVSAISLKSHDGSCPCPAGYEKRGRDCHQSCLKRWRDDGLTCRISDYSRGTGFRWQMSDGFGSEGVKKRCARSSGEE